MRYLLDSHILHWFRFHSPRIPKQIYELLDDTDAVYYSVITPWELSIKHLKGKLPLPDGFFDTLPTLGFDCIPIEESHIHALRSLPDLHSDPFDRMLVAQASAEKMTLITHDRNLAAYPIKTLLV